MIAVLGMSEGATCAKSEPQSVANFKYYHNHTFWFPISKRRSHVMFEFPLPADFNARTNAFGLHHRLTFSFFLIRWKAIGFRGECTVMAAIFFFLSSEHLQYTIWCPAHFGSTCNESKDNCSPLQAWRLTGAPCVCMHVQRAHERSFGELVIARTVPHEQRKGGGQMPFFKSSVHSLHVTLFAAKSVFYARRAFGSSC